MRVHYKEYRISGGEICKGQEDSSWPDYEPEYREFILGKICLKETEEDHYYETVHPSFDVKVGDKVWVVVVRYITGNTFGSVCGCGAIAGIYQTEEKAREAENLILTDKWPKEYPPWKGYFECLESVEIHERVVQ